MQRATSSSTKKTYRSSFQHYLRWCEENNRDPITASWQDRLLCLAQIAEKGTLSTKTILMIRTAISRLTAPVDGIAFGELPETMEFIKGLQNMKPIPTKDKSFRWDISILVNYLETLQPWTDLSLQQKGMKSHALLCLATGWRPASDFSRTLAKVQFHPSDDPNWPQAMVLTAMKVKEGGDKTTLPIYRLTDNKNLCPVWCTRQYLTDTNTIRHPHAKNLSISSTSYTNLSPDRLRNWLKLAMQSAGIDPRHSPHSVRAESTTTALEMGASMDDILKCGNWSTKSTFERFYHLQHRTIPAKRSLTMADLTIGSSAPQQRIRSNNFGMSDDVGQLHISESKRTEYGALP